MRLLHRVLAMLPNTNKPQRKFVGHLIGLLLMCPGHATFRNLSRYSGYHEKTFARQFATPYDFVALNPAAITAVVPKAHEQALVIDASFLAKSGQHTYGRDRFWNRTHGRAERGLAVSVLGWGDITHNSAYRLSVEHTPPAQDAEPDQTRIDASRNPLTRVGTHYRLQPLQYVRTDGAYSKAKFVQGVRKLTLHQIGTWRRDATLRYLYTGPRRAGPGRPQQDDGKVDWRALSRFDRVETDEEGVVLYCQTVNHGQCTRNVRVVKVVETRSNRSAVLFSTDVALPATTIYRYDKARFQVACLFREAQQFTGLSDCQARSPAQLHFPCNASLTAVTMAKLEARQETEKQASPFSMASRKRRYFNQHLLDRILAT